MNNKGRVSLLVLSAILAANASFAKPTQTTNFSAVQPNYAVQTQQPYYSGQYSQPQYQAQQPVNAYVSPLQGNVVMVPPNVNIPAVTTMEYNTETMAVGQNVSLVLAQPFSYNGTVVAPAGSTIMGTAIQAKSAGHGTRNGCLQIKFTCLTTPQGQTIPISGKLRTDDGSGIVYGGTKMDTTKEYAKDMGVGAGIGAVAGLTMGALSGGKVGKGAVYGTAVGAGGGLVKSLWDKGGEVVIPANAAVDVVLDQPMTYSPIQYQ